MGFLIIQSEDDWGPIFIQTDYNCQAFSQCIVLMASYLRDVFNSTAYLTVRRDAGYSPKFLKFRNCFSSVFEFLT